MSEPGLKSIEAYFAELADPRVQGRCGHKLVEIIIIAICAVICGANGWSEVETFGKAKEGWLRRFLTLPNGIPSHDTFGRVFSLVDGNAFAECFIKWVESVFRVTAGQVIAIDGKTVRGSQDEPHGKAAIHIVSAWASANGLTLGQIKVNEKSNEITAIPELLKILDVQGCIVSIDAMGTQKTIASTIIDSHADYILALKGNQGHLHEDVQEWFAYAQQRGWGSVPHAYAETTNKVSGRVEVRRLWAIDDPLAFEYIRHYQGWVGLRTIIMLQRERLYQGHLQTETAYYISSLSSNAPRLLDAIRHHWAIENTCHWTLDVIFQEDDSRIHSGEAQKIWLSCVVLLSISSSMTSPKTLSSKSASVLL